MSTDWIFRTLIVPNASVVAARNLADCVDPAGAGMWTTGLSPSGKAPATHWISSGHIRPEFASMLSDPTITFYAAQSGADAQGKTLTATLADCQALIQQADISAEQPFGAMARLGLKMVAQDESEQPG